MNISSFHSPDIRSDVEHTTPSLNTICLESRHAIDVDDDMEDVASNVEVCMTPVTCNVSDIKSFPSLSQSMICDPPLLNQRPTSFRNYRSWNGEESTTTQLIAGGNAPLFPDSPTLTSIQRPSHTTPIVTNDPSSSSSSSTISLFDSIQRNQTSSMMSDDGQHPTRSSSSSSLPRRILLSFQDCHFVRLPPRVSRTDNYLHDISWRIQSMTSSSTTTIPSNTTGITQGTLTTPHRKKNRTNYDGTSNEDDMPLLTPVEGYTISTTPARNFFVQDHERNTSHHDLYHSEQSSQSQPTQSDANKFFYCKDKKYVRQLWETPKSMNESRGNSNSSSSNSSDSSSRDPTPLPLLDLDDETDSESFASSTEGLRSERTSTSPTTISMMNGDVSESTTTSSSSLPTFRTIPIKQPKLKMRTNHPVVVQTERFATILHQPPPPPSSSTHPTF